MGHRGAFTPRDIVQEIWAHLELPASALASLSLPGLSSADGREGGGGGGGGEEEAPGPAVPSSFKIGHLAQSTIALSALAAATAHSGLSGRSTPFITTTASSSSSPSPPPRITVPLRHAVLEFQCERLYTLAGRPPAETWGPIGGLHPTAGDGDGDGNGNGNGGYVRVHDAFPHHRRGVLRLLGLPEDCADRRAVSARTRGWDAVALETAAVDGAGVAAYALRSFEEWDALPQARALADMPVNIRRVDVPTTMTTTTTTTMTAPAPAPRWCGDIGGGGGGRRLLAGLRVLELSRVIAAPVAGKTLAAHGADVLWVTSPRLPDLPGLDREFARGKRTAQLDLDDAADRARLRDLARGADVVLQGYRPGSGLTAAARHGPLDAAALAAANPGVVVANLSAFGPDGPWAARRGFDSLVQACSGLNAAEARSAGDGEPARALPCQALDHAAGFLLAAGICAAVCRRERDRREGRAAGAHAYVVDVSLAGVMKYLRSLGQFEGRSGFEAGDCTVFRGDEDARAFFDTRDTPFGEMRFLRHSASVDGFDTSWDLMPAPLGSAEAAWRDS
ncbi:putative CAIB BAIF family enzyme [Rosellinia necatrix]|uniref:Putative CAIB BAIF family enzyme n=1 Tax=Rosellinia necatrix TaxID=77044 RepID=A0A1W2TF60_ROSNE|nr:putative CAIB BAIF family enzyme [Rosellinia necatrix]